MDPAAPVEESLAAPPAGAASMDRGDVVNLVAELRRRLEADGELPKLTDVQNRLVMQRLEENGTWKKPRAGLEEQVEEIAAAVARVTGRGPDAFEERIEACL